MRLEGEKHHRELAALSTPCPAQRPLATAAAARSGRRGAAPSAEPQILVIHHKGREKQPALKSPKDNATASEDLCIDTFRYENLPLPTLLDILTVVPNVQQ